MTSKKVNVITRFYLFIYIIIFILAARIHFITVYSWVMFIATMRHSHSSGSVIHPLLSVSLLQLVHIKDADWLSSVRFIETGENSCDLGCCTYTSSMEKSLHWGIFTWRTRNLWRSPTEKTCSEFLLTGKKQRLETDAYVVVTYETFSHFLAFASSLFGCFPPDSKQILVLLYYTPKWRNISNF